MLCQSLQLFLAMTVRYNVMKYAIKTKNLSKRFMGVSAVDNLSVNIPEGLATGLIGPNGSGKTTLMNLLTGLLRPDEGHIDINGYRVNKVKPTKLRSLKIARTFQDGRLIEQLSVEDNLLLAVAECNEWKALLDIGNKRYKSKLDEVLKIVHLDEHRAKNASDLSYGQRKLLEIGRAMMQDADIFFFDEPFTGLFPEVVTQVCEILEKLKEQGKTLVIIEHNMGLIQKLCDYTIVLDYGKLLAHGSPQEVLENKKVQEAYLGK